MKKRRKKLLLALSRLPFGAKVFWFFFSKKNLLLAVPLLAASPDDAHRHLIQAERDEAARAAAQRAAEQHARAAADQAARLAADRLAAGTALRNTQAATATASARLDAIEASRRDAEARLAILQAKIEPLLPLLQRLRLYPAETLLAAPLPAEQAITGLIVVEGLADQVRAEAAAIEAQRAAVAALHRQAVEAATKLQAAQARQSSEVVALDHSLATARTGEATAERRALAASQAEQQAAALADALKSAIAQADAATTRLPASTASPGLAGGSHLTTPVAAPLVRRFGDPTEAGPATGLSYQPTPGARIVAPCRGRIVFGADVQGLGLLAILDCGAGWHVVLSGLGQLDAKPGTAVLAGQPIGHASEQRLYLEVRHRGQPVDPRLS